MAAEKPALKVKSGTEDFAKYIKDGYYYVDKTQYLRPIFDADDRLLILRPRRFGKTLMMSTLRHFLEMDYDNPGDTSKQQELFKGLKVSEEQEFCEANMGRHPVVSVSLKDAGQTTFQSSRRMLAMTVWKLSNQYEWLKNSPKLNDGEKEFLDDLLNRKLLCRGDGESDGVLQSSLSMLCQLLHHHCGLKPVLLIDEYDVPLQYAAMNHFYDQMIEIIKPLFSVLLKTNPDVSKGILTGCLRATKEGIFTDLNNFTLNTALSNNDSLSGAFGFTTDEVKAMLSYYGLEDFCERARTSYDGYRFGSKEIYCPWDVTCYTADLLIPREGGPAALDPPAYWNNTSDNRIIIQYMPNLSSDDAQKLQDLVDGRSIKVAIDEGMNYGNFHLDDPAQFWNILVYTGYLTLAKRGTDDVHEFRIPNAEVRKCFEKNIQSYYQERGGKYSKDYSVRIVELLLSGKADDLPAELTRALSTFVSVRDAAGKEPKENYYHGLLNGILLSAGNLIGNHTSNADSGDGYADIVFTSASQKTGVVIELKYSPERSDLKAKAKEALKQIEDRDYAAALNSNVVKKVYAWGIAFWHRQCAVAFKELNP